VRALQGHTVALRQLTWPQKVSKCSKKDILSACRQAKLLKRLLSLFFIVILRKTQVIGTYFISAF
jgi:hypothetical protein